MPAGDAPASPEAPAPNPPASPVPPASPDAPDVPAAPSDAVVPERPWAEPDGPAAPTAAGTGTVIDVDETAGVVVIEVEGEHIEVSLTALEDALGTSTKAVTIEGGRGVDAAGQIALVGAGTMLLVGGVRLFRGTGGSPVRMAAPPIPGHPLPPPAPGTQLG